ALEPTGLHFLIIVDKDVPITVDRFPAKITFSITNIEIIAFFLLGQLRSVNNRDSMVFGTEDFREGLDFFFVGSPNAGPDKIEASGPVGRDCHMDGADRIFDI